MEGGCAKLAVTPMLLFIVIAMEFVLPLASPLQLTKIHPVAGNAEAVTVELLAYTPPAGVRETVPSPFEDTLREYVGIS